MTTNPAAQPPATSETALLAAFEQRVLTRDVPAPVPLDAASVLARIRAALRERLQQRDRRRLGRLAHICHQFMAAPTQLSTAPALVEALGLSPSGLARNWRELHEAGLVEAVPAGRRGGYRLSRAGEDWLLAVVKGDTPPA